MLKQCGCLRYPGFPSAITMGYCQVQLGKLLADDSYETDVIMRVTAVSPLQSEMQLHLGAKW
jgi:hypothetical protein